ncbi:MAG TPA: hypothetical protein VMH91_02445 [Candidatus Paceibacterota bacterium]|nr:hypothetical protein [Candidatus Paceibacterota bacterium]
MLLWHLRPDIFKEATLNLGFKDRNLEWSPEKVALCASTLRAIIEVAPDHADDTDKDLMGVVDGVMLKFYPHHQRWDDPRLQRFLLENATKLETVANDEPIEKEELERLFRFCEEMWIALASFDARRNASNRQ